MTGSYFILFDINVKMYFFITYFSVTVGGYGTEKIQTMPLEQATANKPSRTNVSGITCGNTSQAPEGHQSIPQTVPRSCARPNTNDGELK